METLARHLLVELRGCTSEVLAEKPLLAFAMDAIARGLGGPVRHRHVAKTGSTSLTGVVIAENAHMAVRTWPRQGCATADIMIEGESLPDDALKCLLESFQPDSHVAFEVGRGPCLDSASERIKQT